MTASNSAIYDPALRMLKKVNSTQDILIPFMESSRRDGRNLYLKKSQNSRHLFDAWDRGRT